MGELTSEQLRQIIDGAPDENHAIEVNEQVIPTSLRQVHHYVPDLKEILALRERVERQANLLHKCCEHIEDVNCVIFDPEIDQDKRNLYAEGKMLIKNILIKPKENTNERD